MNISRIVFMNAPILTAEGVWTYRMLGNAKNAKVWLAGNEWDGVQGYDPVPRLSAVGHESTAEAMTELLGERVEVNRINYAAEPGDACLVMKLRGRIPEGQTLDRKELEEVGYGFYLMEFSLPIELGGEEKEWLPAVRGLVYHITSMHAVRFCGGVDHLGYHKAITQAFGVGLGPASQIGYNLALKAGWEKTGEALAGYDT